MISQPVYNYNVLSSRGPPRWYEINPSYQCNGNRQSPINIQTQQLGKINNENNFRVSDIDNQINEVQLTLKDWSFDIKLKFSNEKKPKLNGGPLGYTYELVSSHYHWGLENREGSEHTINNQSFALEAHHIFMNLKYSKNMDEALMRPDGLAVIGKFYDVRDGAPDIPLINNIARFNNGEVKSVNFRPDDSVTFRTFFGDGAFNYIHYNGSLTTPPCAEAVLWFVSLDINNINPKQMKLFRHLIDKNHLLAAPNYRTPQKLNGRRVVAARAVLDERTSPKTDDSIHFPGIFENLFG